MPIGTGTLLAAGGGALLLAMLARKDEPDRKEKEAKEKEAEADEKKFDYGPFTDETCSKLKTGTAASLWHDEKLVPAIDKNLKYYDVPIVSAGALANLVMESIDDALAGAYCKTKPGPLLQQLFKDSWCTAAYYLASKGVMDEEPEDVAAACANEAFSPYGDLKKPVEAATLTPGATLLEPGYAYRLRLPYRTPETVVLLHKTVNGKNQPTDDLDAVGWAEDDDKEFIVRIPGNITGAYQAQAMDKAGQDNPYDGVFIAEYILTIE